MVNDRYQKFSKGHTSIPYPLPKKACGMSLANQVLKGLTKVRFDWPLDMYFYCYILYMLHLLIMHHISTCILCKDDNCCYKTKSCAGFVVNSTNDTMVTTNTYSPIKCIHV